MSISQDNTTTPGVSFDDMVAQSIGANVDKEVFWGALPETPKEGPNNVTSGGQPLSDDKGQGAQAGPVFIAREEKIKGDVNREIDYFVKPGLGILRAAVAGDFQNTKRWQIIDDLKSLKQAYYEYALEFGTFMKFTAKEALLLTCVEVLFTQLQEPFLYRQAAKKNKNVRAVVDDAQAAEENGHSSQSQQSEPGKPSVDGDGAPFYTPRLSPRQRAAKPSVSLPYVSWAHSGKPNPIDDETNAARLLQGGPTCTICGVNTCNPGKTVCSSVCAGVKSSIAKKNNPVKRRARPKR